MCVVEAVPPAAAMHITKLLGDVLLHVVLIYYSTMYIPTLLSGCVLLKLYL